MITKVIGLVMMGIGLAFVYASNFVFYKMQEDLTEKFPDRIDWILGSSTKETFAFDKTGKLYRMHAEAFPLSPRRSKSIAFFIAGAMVAFAGFWILALFS